MTSILLTGAAGQVGSALHRVLAPHADLRIATRDGVLPDGTLCEAIDLAQPASIAGALGRLQPRVLINPAAYTAVDRAESEPELAQRVNVDAVDAMARWCADNDALMIHYSTDYVFDGQAQVPWVEDAPTAPLGVYGRSKRDGEDALRASGARHLILRTAWVYAASGSNFLRTMLRLAAERDVLRVVDDQVGAPTPAHWIAAASAALLARIETANAETLRLGTFHLAASGQTSWHGFAAAIFDAAEAVGKLPRRPTLQPIATRDYPTPARRPAYSVLDGSRLREAHGIALPDWRHGVTEVIDAVDPAPRPPQTP